MKIELDLTAKQIEKIKEMLKKESMIEKKNQFQRKRGKMFYSIGAKGNIYNTVEWNGYYETSLFKVANYCTDKDLMEKQALREEFNRLLWRYAEIHNGEIDWSNNNIGKAYIYYNYLNKEWGAARNITWIEQGTVYFSSVEIAENAIEEIVKPFVKEHGMDWYF